MLNYDRHETLDSKNIHRLFQPGDVVLGVRRRGREFGYVKQQLQRTSQ